MSSRVTIAQFPPSSFGIVVVARSAAGADQLKWHMDSPAAHHFGPAEARRALN